jgi:hypothetical protein
MKKIIIGVFAFLGFLVALSFLIRITRSSFGKIIIPSQKEVSREVAPSIPVPGGTSKVETALLSRGELAEETSSEEGGSISERLIIKSGSMSLLVANVGEVVANIIKFAEDEGGFVIHSNVHRINPESERLTGAVTIKIPAEKFTQAFNRLKDFALKVTNENLSGQDVTEEYTDLESRVRNLEAAETQLLELMKKAGKVTEILEVQRELVKTRQQIETTRGRMEFLEKSAKMATIYINLATEEEELPVVEEEWRPKKVARAALRSLVRLWQKVGNIVIWSAVFFSPFIVIGAAVFLWRKRKGLRKPQ